MKYIDMTIGISFTHSFALACVHSHTYVHINVLTYTVESSN